MTAFIDPDMSMAAYRAVIAASSSDLKAIRTECPGMVPWRRSHPHDETDATRFGTACHALILEPRKWTDLYAVKPEGMTFASKEGKAWRDTVAAGRTIINHDDHQRATGVLGAYVSSKAPPPWEMKREASVFWTAGGTSCKGRPDMYDDEWLYDLKVTVHAHPAMIGRAAWNNGWMHQGAWYRDGLAANGIKVRGFRLVAIQPKAPHRVVLAEVKDSALDICALENERALATYAECERTGTWPWFDSEYVKLEVPPWALGDFMANEINDAVEVDDGI